jgi:DNA polymerase III delta subunit
MFYLFHGKSRKKASEKAYALVKGLLSKKPDASYVRVGVDDWHEDILLELSGTQGLFESKHVILCDDLWSEALPNEDDIDVIANSPNVFILIETNLSPSQKKTLVKLAKGETEVTKDEERETFNIFTLSDALSVKDKKRLWLLYREALASNVDPEDILNILFWQIKNLVLAKRNLLSGKLKVSPYVASKAKQGAVNWKDDELETKAKQIVDIYHMSRLGQADMEVSLERLILEM